MRTKEWNTENKRIERLVKKIKGSEKVQGLDSVLDLAK